MRSRQGFTLLEVMVALVLTAIVVSVAYAMSSAAIDARARLTSGLRTVQGSRAAREMLRDALRNARAPRPPSIPGGVYLSHDTLSFIASSGVSPLDPDYDWQFTVAPGRGALGVTAIAIGHARPATVAFAVPEVTRWSVRLLAPDGQSWVNAWHDTTFMPAAALITFWNGDRLSGLPLHVALPAHAR